MAKARECKGCFELDETTKRRRDVKETLCDECYDETMNEQAMYAEELRESLAGEWDEDANG